MTMNIDRAANPPELDDPAGLHGVTVVGADGAKLGRVDAVYHDNATDRPEWVSVRHGLFGTRVALVPLRRAHHADGVLRVPFDQVQLRNAPHHRPGRELSVEEETDLYRHYGVDHRHPATGDAVRRTDAADDSVQTVEFRLDDD